MIKKDKKYCVSCTFRKEIKTNISDFCILGYKQNPTTNEATLNVISAGGQVCERNPFIKEKRRGRYLFELERKKLMNSLRHQKSVVAVR